MRLSLRFVVPLILALAAVAYAVVPLVDRLTLRWFVRDLDLRAGIVASTMQEQLLAQLTSGNRSRAEQYFTRLTQDERLFAIGFCSSRDGSLIATRGFPTTIKCDDLRVFEKASARQLTGAHGALHVSVSPVDLDSAHAGSLVLVHDMSFIERRSEETRKYLFYLFVGLGVVVSLITVVIAQLSWRGWMLGLRSLMRGEGLLRPVAENVSTELHPLAKDLRSLLRDVEAAHLARDEAHVVWTPETLRELLHDELPGHEVIVVANREPYLHERVGTSIEVRRPASGLVTALEPIMRACSGTWIGHGNGSADRAVVDSHDRVAVPPDAPTYEIRRIWLSEAEEAGYYYGFANEGLWPLCHIAHVRPTFRSSDWEIYKAVNKRFARAVAEEATSSDPIVLVQDYHFALAPRMIRRLLPTATVVTFWHIPWPNPEAFAICPWREELLDGMLGSNILGFHTQFHCNNFLDTVDRLLEARVDRETFTVTCNGEHTAVKRYPISIEWPPTSAILAGSVEDARGAIRARHGLTANHAIGVGIDRLDYTKGIEERFNAVERLLERHPEWIGRFSFIQIAAPTRSVIDEYREYEARVRALARRINARFEHGGRPPIILHVEHHEPASVYEYYRGADLCFVSSLHDGMNLVAKEFVAARDDERGVLVLSRFTGAARELPEALIVNPYDSDECASALHVALSMPPAEQRDRMRLMRGLLRDFNVFRWAGRMLIDATVMRRRERFRKRASTAA